MINFDKHFSHSRAQFFNIIALRKNMPTQDIYDLYSDICKELYDFVCCFELVLRNRIDFFATRKFGKEWFCDSRIHWSATSQEQLVDAGAGIGEHNSVVCHLTFGFWVNMFVKSTANILWKDVLSLVFPTASDLIALHTALEKVQKLRNDIMHSSIIIKDEKKLLERYEIMRDLLSNMAPDVAGWKLKTNRFQECFTRLLAGKTIPSAPMSEGI